MKWIDRSIIGPKFGNEAWPYIELGRSKIDPISRRVSGSPIERALLVIAVIVYTNNREIKRVFTGHAATISTRVACICSCFLDSGNSNGESYRVQRVQRRRTNVSVGYQARGCREDWTKFGLAEGKGAISRAESVEARLRICHSILGTGSNVPLEHTKPHFDTLFYVFVCATSISCKTSKSLTIKRAMTTTLKFSTLVFETTRTS